MPIVRLSLVLSVTVLYGFLRSSSFSFQMMSCDNGARRVAPVVGSHAPAPHKATRVNGWTCPPQLNQVSAWLLLSYLATVSFGIFIPLLPLPWTYVVYTVSLPQALQSRRRQLVGYTIHCFRLKSFPNGFVMLCWCQSRQMSLVLCSALLVKPTRVYQCLWSRVNCCCATATSGLVYVIFDNFIILTADNECSVRLLLMYF